MWCKAPYINGVRTCGSSCVRGVDPRHRVNVDRLFPYLDQDLRKFWWMALGDLMRGHSARDSQWRMSWHMLRLVIVMATNESTFMPSRDVALGKAGSASLLGIPIAFDDTADVVTIEARRSS